MRESIDALLRNAVESGAAPNLSAIVADRDGLRYEGGAGAVTPGSSEIVDTATCYRLASMTKLVTTVAALQLVEAGRLGAEDAVGTYLPAIDELPVLERMGPEGPVLRPAEGRVTVRQLMTHTSGLTYWFFSPEVHAWEQATGVPNVLAGDARAFTAPLVADPGSRFEYGMSTDYLGRIVEEVSGVKLPDYLEEHVTGPLKMASTTFQPGDEQRARLVPVHVPNEGAWVATEIDWPREPDWWAGGHALYSTPRDYIRFQRAVLRGGELDGVRILSEQTVRDMFTPQIGDLDMPEVVPAADPMSTCDYPSGPGQTWGWGLQLNRRQIPGMRAPLSGSWAGLANTHFWIDPTTGVAASLYSQFLPFVTPDLMTVYAEFERAVYAGLNA